MLSCASTLLRCDKALAPVPHRRRARHPDLLPRTPSWFVLLNNKYFKAKDVTAPIAGLTEGIHAVMFIDETSSVMDIKFSFDIRNLCSYPPTRQLQVYDTRRPPLAMIARGSLVGIFPRVGTGRAARTSMWCSRASTACSANGPGARIYTRSNAGYPPRWPSRAC
jgi:hypothetical protein